MPVFTSTFARRLCAAVLLAFAADAAADQAMVNGGFDSGGLAGWYFQAQGGGQGTAKAVTAPKKGGTHSARVIVTTATPANAWKVQLGQAGVPLVQGQSHKITFWAKASAARQGELAIQQGGPPYDAYLVRALALTTAWKKFTFTFKPNATVSDALFNFNLGQAAGTVWIDTVSMVATTTTLPGPALSIDTGAERHRISDDIYGMNFTDPAVGDALRISVDRWGGNNVETYNWELGSDNTDNDYYWENIADCILYSTGCGGGNVPFYPTFISRDLAANRAPLITVPMMGYVAKDAPVKHPFTCSFPRAQFPNQQSFDPYDTHCGNGVRGDGVPLDANPLTAGKAIAPSYAAGWVADIVGRFGLASAGGVHYYELGNEPNLWNSTHRDQHPAATTYDELLSRSIDTAVAVKQSDPTAKVLAFSEWGWPNYFCSAADHVENGCSETSPDRAAHGGTALGEWLLQQFHDHEIATGQRIVDYIDLHYYRQGGETTDVTRSLWDPTYVDPSWIDDTIRLIPRMHEWVNQDYPGTKLALTEYNLSVYSNARLNALLQADVLGIFARERLDLATRWAMPEDGEGADLEAVYDAFRIYRNYDGAGSGFGQTWVRSRSAGQRLLAIYGAQRDGDNKLTLVVINKTSNTLTSAVSFAGSTPSGNAQVWRWEGAGIQHLADQDVNGTTLAYPPLSITLLVVPVN
jgi:hypothetical protein